MHELDKLDNFLGIERGISYETIIRHGDPTKLNVALAPFGIVLDKFGMVPKQQHSKWRSLMQQVGISQQYWKDKELLMAEAVITHLEEQ